MLETAFNQKLTLHARHSFKEARDIARYTKHPTIEPEHLLLAILLEQGSLGSMLLENMGFEKESLAKLCLKKKVGAKRGLTATPLPLSPDLKGVLRRAYAIASEFHYPYVGTEHLVYSLVETETEAIDNIFLTLKIDEAKIDSVLDTHIHFDHFPHMAKMFDFSDNHPATKQKAPGKQISPSLDQYTIDMGEDARRRSEVLVGREHELDRLMQILARKNKNNPLLIGEPGVGKTALVSALARRIAEGDVPAAFFGKRILSLDLTLVVAGTNFRGEFEARLKEIIKEASVNPDVILFIDELHTIVGAGNTSGGLDAANILKPALSRGDIQVIGATTLSEYKRHLEKDAALERRFQSILVSEPTPEETKTMLGHLKEDYERFHIVTLPKESADQAVDLGIRYLPDRFLPDKALDIIDEACALAKQRLHQDRSSRTLFKWEAEKRQALDMKRSLIQNERYDEAATWHLQERALAKKIEAFKEKSGKKDNEERPVVTTSDILRTVSQMTGIPFAKLSKEQPSEKLSRLRLALGKRLIGQGEAAQTLERTLLRSLSNIGDPDRPLGSFLLLGPTGVGKTLAAKILAEEYFGDKNALIRLDMSEFMERHSVAQIIGAPAGYIGYGEGGKLTEKVRRRPHAVILFDEIEKAHPDVFNILLQILDEGVLTDAEGRKVSFKNTLIILTSNIGTAAFTQTARIGFGKHLHSADLKDDFEAIKRQVLEELKKELRPELLARLDHVLVMNALEKKDIAAIVSLELDRLKKRLKEKDVMLTAPKSVITFLAEKSFAPEQGARLVRKNIQDMVERAVAETLIKKPKKTLRLSVRNNTIVCA